MTVPTLRPLSVGEVLDVSFGLYRAKFVPLLLIVVACKLVPIVLGVYVQSAGGLFEHVGLFLVASLVNIMLSAIAVGASTFVISDTYLGREASAGDALGRSIALTWRLVVVSVLVAMALAMGFVLFVIPGFILLSGLILSTVVAVLEPNVRTLSTLDRSWQLSQGFRGKVFAAMLVAFLLLVIPTIVASVALAIFGMVFTSSGLLVGALISALVQIFITPYVYVVLTVLYYDLRVRKEGLDLEILATALQPA